MLRGRSAAAGGVEASGADCAAVIDAEEPSPATMRSHTGIRKRRAMALLLTLLSLRAGIVYQRLSSASSRPCPGGSTDAFGIHSRGDCCDELLRVDRLSHVRIEAGSQRFLTFSHGRVCRDRDSRNGPARACRETADGANERISVLPWHPDVGDERIEGLLTEG